MSEEKKEIVESLVALKDSLSKIEYIDRQEIQKLIDDTIIEIQDARCEGIKISVALSKVIEKMNRSLAFNGLKLDRQTSLIWDHLKDLYDKSKRSERTAVSILKGLWGMNS
ncbi:TPA: hypothetical protein LY532_001202 [Enterococcus faecium]|nr:hypothetical protein [Enterococcus faecium]